MDLIAGLPETVNGNTCIVVIVDRLIKMVHFAAAPTNTGALECAKLLRHHVCRLHGMPRDIVSNQDARWKGKFWTELCRLWGITQSMRTEERKEKKVYAVKRHNGNQATAQSPGGG